MYYSTEKKKIKCDHLYGCHLDGSYFLKCSAKKINKQTKIQLQKCYLIWSWFYDCSVYALIHNSKAHVRIYEILFQKIIGLMNSKINRKISKFSVKSSDIGRIIFCVQLQGTQKLEVYVFMDNFSIFFYLF